MKKKKLRQMKQELNKVAEKPVQKKPKKAKGV
jgi:hypothetical protein